MNKFFLCLLLIGAGCAKTITGHRTEASTEADFKNLSGEFIAGYLAWRPQTGTSLGFHEYDGKVTDFSKPSLDRELKRLKEFDSRLARMGGKEVRPHPGPLPREREAAAGNKLSATSFSDYRLLRSAIQREIFSFEGMEIYTRNPMTYATAL